MNWTVESLVRGARVCRRIPYIGKSIVSAVKSRASLDLTLVLHEQVIHKMRTLSLAVKENEWMSGGQSAIETCTSIRELMGNLTELCPDELHCCLKGFRPNECTNQSDAVVTVARSEPFGNRLIDPRTFDSHLVEQNTVWSSLMGISDSNYTWKRLKCFHCGDLREHISDFKCTSSPSSLMM